MDEGLFRGGCDCGSVRYEASGGPLRVLKCHCRDCQRLGGSAFAAIVSMRAEAVRFTGELRWYAKTGSSGHEIARGFCAGCGSPVAIRPGRAPHLIGLQAGSLDDPSLHRPTMEIYTGSAPDWDVLDEGTQKFEGDFRR